jgi:hypothetical protein
MFGAYYSISGVPLRHAMYNVQLFDDVTGKAFSAALNKLGFGVHLLGAHT